MLPLFWGVEAPQVLGKQCSASELELLLDVGMETIAVVTVVVLLALFGADEVIALRLVCDAPWWRLRAVFGNRICISFISSWTASDNLGCWKKKEESISECYYIVFSKLVVILWNTERKEVIKLYEKCKLAYEENVKVK